MVEGKEPNHFLAMFQGKLKVFQGGLSSSFEGNIRLLLVLIDSTIMCFSYKYNITFVVFIHHFYLRWSETGIE